MKTSEKALAEKRTGFVSGSLLVWGLALISLRSTLRTMQAPSLVVFEGGFKGEGQVGLLDSGLLDYGTISFYVLAWLSALGISIAVIAVFYLLAFGLTLRPTQAWKSLQAACEAVQRRRYEDFFLVTGVLGAFAAFSVVLYLMVFLQRLLVGFGGWTEKFSLILSFTLTFGLAAAVTLVWLRNALKCVMDFLAKQVAWRSLYLGPLLLISYVAVIETAYTADIDVDKSLYERTSDSYARIEVRLGGATSNRRLMTLQIADLAGTTSIDASSRIVKLSDGRYFTHLPIKELAPGTYQVTLTYDPRGLTEIAQILRRRVEKRVGFVVAD